jgi:hypothetical protein
VVVLLIGTVFALDGPSTFFSESDVSSVKGFVVSAQKEDGSFGSLEDTYNAVSTLKRLGVEVPKAKAVIDFAKASLPGAKLAGTYQAVSIISQLGGDIPSEAFAGAISTLRSVDEVTLEDASHSALILSLQKPVNKKLATLVERIAGLVDTDGSYRNEEWDAGTVSHSVLALKALAAIPTAILAPLETLTVEEAGTKVSELIAAHKIEVEGALSLVESKVSAVKTTGGIVDSLNQLATKNAKVRSAITAVGILSNILLLPSHSSHSDSVLVPSFRLKHLNSLSFWFATKFLILWRMLITLSLDLRVSPTGNSTTHSSFPSLMVLFPPTPNPSSR